MSATLIKDAVQFLCITYSITAKYFDPCATKSQESRNNCRLTLLLLLEQSIIYVRFLLFIFKWNIFIRITLYSWNKDN